MAQQMIGDVLKKGEEIFQNVSGRLLEQPAVQKAVEAAMVGKGKVDEGFALALKRMNVQTRSEFRNLKNRVEGLESQVTALQEALRAARAELRKPAKRGARKAAKKA
jgi:polyhydroxyalkanoate synthesis regulator phasin